MCFTTAGTKSTKHGANILALTLALYELRKRRTRRNAAKEETCRGKEIAPTSIDIVESALD